VLRGAFKNTGEIHMFVLLEIYNDYNQYGRYYCGVFSTREKAREQVDHIGRKNWEYSWYVIEAVELNVNLYSQDW
jgi:hypothetical protein